MAQKAARQDTTAFGAEHRGPSRTVVGLLAALVAAILMILVMALLRSVLGVSPPPEMIPDRRDVRREERQVGDAGRAGRPRRAGLLRAAGLGSGFRGPDPLEDLRARLLGATTGRPADRAEGDRLWRRPRYLAGRDQPGRRPVWQEARLEHPGTRLSWAIWGHEWRPTRPGEYRLAIRGFDASGAPQPAEERGIVPTGARGYHRVTVQIVA